MGTITMSGKQAARDFDADALRASSREVTSLSVEWVCPGPEAIRFKERSKLTPKNYQAVGRSSAARHCRLKFLRTRRPRFRQEAQGDQESAEANGSRSDKLAPNRLAPSSSDPPSDHILDR